MVGLVTTVGMAADDPDELARVQRERDLYRRLLDLGRKDEPEPFLREALGLVVEVTGARQGYLELHDDDHTGTPRWALAHGFTAEQLAGVRAAISRGIIAEALATGKTIVTPSALLDERFRARESVRLRQIEAVLCAPIGDDPPRGVLYLQNRAGHGFFSEDDRAWAETFARHLAPLVDRLLARQRERAGMDATAPVRATLRAPDVIGRGAALATALHHVALVAPLDVHVLLTGETGTGKSQLARVIHDNGPRATHPFVTLNCATLPETLIESELFGALPGAHSTATRRIEGKVESAERRFREDLFYRLQVLPIRVPSLAERREDIPLLAVFFCAQACQRHGLPRLELSPNALHAAESVAWPGNVRQLENAVEAAVIRAAGAHAEQVERAHLFPEEAARPEAGAPVTFQEATRRFQERLLQDALEAEGWNVVDTARRLDLARSHVYNLIRAFGLERGRR